MAKVLRIFTTVGLSLIFWTLCSEALRKPSSIKLENNEYTGIVVAIHPDEPENTQIIDIIKEMFRSGSSYLYQATKQRAFFKEVTILIPQTWSDQPSYTSPVDATFNGADLIIAAFNPRFAPDGEHSAAPYTKHLEGCGKQGLYIHMTSHFLEQYQQLQEPYGDYGRVLVHQWGHYRWGLFNEYPDVVTDRDNARYFYVSGKTELWEPVSCPRGWQFLYLKYQSDARRYTLCNGNEQVGYENGCFSGPVQDQPHVSGSIMHCFLTFPQVVNFCDNDTNGDPSYLHNSEAPTQHNRMCDERSNWEVMREHTDFKDDRNPRREINDVTPIFHVVRSKPGQVVLVLDTSTSMSTNDRHLRLADAARTYILSIATPVTYVGIVDFDGDAHVVSYLTELVSEEVRTDLANQVPEDADGLTCIGCGMQIALDVLRDSNGNVNGGRIVLITDGKDSDGDADLLEMMKMEYINNNVIIDSIAISDNAEADLVDLSDSTGGKFFLQTDSSESTGIRDAFVGSLDNTGGNDQRIEISLDVKTFAVGETEYQSSVYIDSTLGNQTSFDFTYISSSTGWGIITRTPRVKREFILEYAGDEISAAEAARREIRYEDEGLGSYMFYFGRNKCIDATIDNGRLGRFVNDAVGKKENCVMKPVKISGSTRLCLFAKRDIDAGEELRYDYGIDDLPWRKKQPSALDKGLQEYKPWYDDDDYNPFEDVTLFPNIYSKESSKMIFDNDDISSNMSLSRKGCMENVDVKHPEKDGQQFQSRDTKECQKERFDKGAEKNHIVVDDDSDDTGFLDKGLTEDGPLILKRKENSGKDTNDFLTECDEDGGSTDDDSCDNDSDVAAFSDSNGSKKEEQWQYSSAINGQQASTADTGEEKTRDVAHDDSDQMDFDCQGLIEVKTCNIADDDSDDTGFVVQGLTEDGSVVLKRVGNCGKDTNDFVTDCDEDEGSTDDDSSDNDSDVAAFSDSNGSKKEEQWQHSSAINGQQASTADTGEEKTRDVADDDSDERDFDCQGLSEEECPIGDSSESGDDSTSEYSPEDDEYQRSSDNSFDNSTDNMNERDSPHGEMNIEPDSTQLDNCEIVEDSEDETQGPSSTIPLPTSSMRHSFNKSQRDTPSTSKARYEPRATDAKHSTSNSCEVSSTTGTTRSTGVRIMVSNRANGQNWDKYQYCVYCLQPKAKMARHFQDMHSDEIEVQEAFSFDKKSAERKSRLRVLTNKGNHAHNLEVLKANCGVIIPYKRPTHNLPVEDYIPCERCFGYFIGSDMWKHLKSCPVTKSVSGRNNGLQSRCSLLLPLPVEVDACFKANVLSIMRRDDVSIICRNDPLILTLGQRLFSSLDKESHYMQYISQKMREMGRLLQAIKAENPSIEALDQCLQPSCFDMVVKAVRVCAGYNTSTQKYSTPSLALKLGHSLKKCSGFMKINGIKAEDDIMRNNAERFEELCNLEWSSTVSSHALTTLSQRKWNKPTILPLSEDIVNLHKHLSTKMAESKEMLSTAPDKLAWNTLASAALSKVILFNRRRSGEVQRMHLKDYESCHGHSSNDVFEGLTNWEQKLCQGLSRVEIKGKRGRKVPILLTSEMREVLDVLVASREVVGVSEENPYLFARPSLGSKTPLRGSDCLATMAIESKAQNPAALTSTKLRKHVATVSQLFCLKNHELDILANFLGHDIRVHREYYRLPDDTLQMTKVARLLLAMEKGNATSFKDKQLKDIEIPLDEPCTSDEEDAESDVDDGHDDNDVNDAGSQEDRDKDALALDVIVTSPTGVIYDRNSDSYREYPAFRKITITINGTAEPRSWEILLQNRLTNETYDVTSSVSSYPSQEGVDPILVSSCLIPGEDGVLKLYAEVKQGYSPVIKAEVMAVIESSSGTSSVKQLWDNGAGADITKNDGIYSRFYVPAGGGFHGLKITVVNKGDAVILTSLPKGSRVNAYTDPNKLLAGNLTEIANLNISLPGTPIRDLEGIPAPNFTRGVSGGATRTETPAGGTDDNLPPNKINDFQVISTSYDNGTVEVVFTAPGDDLDSGNANYYVIQRCQFSSQLRHNRTFCPRINQSDVINGNLSSPASFGITEKINFRVPLPSDVDTMSFRIAVYAVDDAGNEGPISNIEDATFRRYIPPPSQEIIPTEQLLETTSTLTSTMAQTNSFPTVAIVFLCIISIAILGCVIIIFILRFCKGITNDSTKGQPV